MHHPPPRGSRLIGFPCFALHRKILFAKSTQSRMYPGAEEYIPNELPPLFGNDVTHTYFVDASHGSNLLNRRSYTGILLFLNRAPIHWYIKSQKTVDSSTFGSEFIALKMDVEMIIAFLFQTKVFRCSN